MSKWEDFYYSPEPRFTKEKPAPDWVFEASSGTAVPESELEALMMAAPGDHIAETMPDHGDTYKNLDAILGVELELDEVEMEVLDCLFVAGHSIRDTADMLEIPQTTVWRIKESTLERIRRRADGRDD